MNKEKCLHKHIIMTTKEHYNIPQGYEELMEQEDIDMQDYFTGNINNSTFCEDCGETLEESPY
jgi:hypothetical protein